MTKHVVSETLGVPLVCRPTFPYTKSAKPSTRTSNRSRGEASTTALASSDQPTTEEIHVGPTAAVDPYADDIADPTFASPDRKSVV